MSGNILFLGNKLFEIPPFFQTRPGDLGKKVRACSLRFSALKPSAITIYVTWSNAHRLYLWPTLGSIYYLDARFDFYFSSLRKTRLPNSQLFNCLCDTFPQVFSVVAQRTSPCGEERCVTRLKTAV